MAYLRRYNITEANTLTKPLNLQDITITPSKELKTYTYDSSLAYNGLGVVSVEGVTAAIDENIIPENIVEGVSILGVVGTNSGSAGIKKIIERNYTKLTKGDLNGITKIASYSFYNATALKEIELPDSLTSIEAYAFQKSGLTSLDIPENTSLVVNSISELNDLTDITLRCKRIVSGAITTCNNLSNITLYNTEYIHKDFCNSEYKGNVFKNGYYLGNDENPIFAFIKSYHLMGTGCEIGENVLVAESCFNDSTLTTVAIPKNVSIGYPLFGSSTSSNIAIYCEADSKPDNWISNWNNKNLTVNWGTKPKTYYVQSDYGDFSYNGILLADYPLIEGVSFWDYYSSSDFSDDNNILPFPYYSSESSPVVYARFETYAKPDGISVNTAFRFTDAKQISFSINTSTGISYFIFTPEETGTYRIDFQETGSGSFDTGMGIFTKSGETYSLYKENDDNSTYGGNEPGIEVSFTAGTDYYIKFSHYSARQSWTQLPSSKPQAGNRFIMHCTKK